jgi:hypothetical protein
LPIISSRSSLRPGNPTRPKNRQRLGGSVRRKAEKNLGSAGLTACATKVK